MLRQVVGEGISLCLELDHDVELTGLQTVDRITQGRASVGLEFHRVGDDGVDLAAELGVDRLGELLDHELDRHAASHRQGHQGSGDRTCSDNEVLAVRKRKSMEHGTRQPFCAFS